ncbi:uncharacterized protein N7506_007421 [Penicillium brevicompactum]|uniref:uncharacterized protein n=1 Tax=Penicillium brevicompactum TaxID=5074 RepID=UPI0025419D25|nr:uncharacterized protein N7506_007421 [Penicillium brevicompactum]KAJ5333638.1 hypothetical protein N7506_007421 [Penicillium brevicompactum]
MDEKERENKEDEFLVAIDTENAALIEHVHVDIFTFCKVAEDDVKIITWVPERVYINHIKKSIPHYSEEKVFDIWKKAYELLAVELQIFSSETSSEHPTEPLSKLAISVHSDDEQVWEHKQLLKGYGWKIQASYSERALHDRWDVGRLLKLSSSLLDMSEDDPILELELDFGLFL